MSAGTQSAVAAVQVAGVAGAPATPQQLTGSADGHPGSVGADATRRKDAPSGPGGHAPAPGELPPAGTDRSVGPESSLAQPTLPAAKVDVPAAAREAEQKQRSTAALRAAPGQGVHSDPKATKVQAPPAAGTEIPSARTASTSTFQNPDGTKTVRVYPRPIHFKESDGSWADIDTAVVQTRSGRWQEAANADAPDFAANAGDPRLVSWSLDADHKVAYGIQGARGSAAKADGNTLMYPGAFPATDIRYDATAQGVKESLLLHDASAPTEWTFPLQLTGLSPSVDSSGNVVFADSTGTQRLAIPHGFMEDSAVDPRSGDGAMSDGVHYSLTTLGGIPALRMELDAAWLHDPHRSFPVRVDPTTQTTVGGGQSTYVMSQFNANYSSESLLKVGTYDGGSHKANAYLTFPVASSALANNYIESAGLALYTVHSAQCEQNEVDVNQITSPWNPSTISTYPGVSLGTTVGIGRFYAGVECSNGPQWEPIDLGDDPSAAGTQLINNWAHGGNNLGLAVTASGTDSNAWKKFASDNSANPPYLYATYSDWAAGISIAGSYTAPTATLPGSQQVTMTNLASNWWNSTTMQLKARVFDSTGTHELSVNAAAVGVPGPQTPVQTGQSVVVQGIIPPLPGNQQYVLCWDGMVGGTTSLHDSYGVPWQDCFRFSSVNVPPQIDTALPQSGTTVGVLSPQLYATGHDPDNFPGTGVDYDFKVYTAPATGNPQLLAESGWQPSPSWKVPGGLLAWNSSYLWTVKAGDHQGESPESQFIRFTTTVQQPLITSRLGGAAGNGTTRSFDPQAGNYTTDATDASVTAVGPALAVSRTYNSLDPRTGSLFGAGWSSSYDLGVVPDGDGDGGVVLTTGDGRTERFGRNDFQLTQLAAAGDQTGDGIDDAVAVDSSTGKLWLYPGPDFSQTKRRWLGDGWNGVSQIAGGDLNGDGIGDVIAVANGNGALNLYPGRSGTTTGEPKTIGASGWNGLQNVTITPPLTADGHKDVVAVDSADGSMYAYPVAADGTLGARVYIGNGWLGFADVVGGDFNHDGHGDLAALTTTGDLLLYSGTGNATLGTSTLGSPTTLATGWKNLRDLTPVNGIPGDQAKGTPADAGTDLLAVDKSTGIQYLYHSSGTAPWSASTRTTTGMPVYTSPAGEFETLATAPGGGFMLADKTSTVYTFAERSGSGYLLSQITDRRQHTQTLHYTGGKLDTATDQASGRALHFTWTTDQRHIAQVATDPANPGDAATALTWTYTYDSANPDRLSQVCTPPAGTNTTRPCTAYTYSPGSHFRTTVLDAGPASYWRLGDAAGATSAASENTANQGTDKGTYTSVTLGTGSGPLNGSATTTAAFDGTASSVSLPNGTLRNSYLAIGLWFKTTSPGALVGYQNQPLGTNPSHGSQPLYIGTDGKLRGEFYGAAIGFTPITSPSAVTDGKWHYAVLSGAGDTQTLYLDGAAVGTLNGAIDHLDTDYTYLGAGYTQNIPWPAAPAPGTAGVNHFNGQLAEAAVYPHALGAPAVAAQWAAAQQLSAELTNLALPSGKTKLAVAYDTVNDRATQYTDPNGGVWKLNQPTVSGSEQEYRGAVLGSRPDGYWRLAESKASQAANTVYTPRPTPNNGTYSNVALGTAGPITGTTAATFDGATSWAEIPAAYAPTSGTGAIALWFKTTSPGILIGYQSFPVDGTYTVGTDQWNPALYVGTDGKLHGQWTGDPARTIATTTSVNDGKWHLAVLSADTTTQTLYLDDQSAGTLTAAPIKASGQTHVYIGAGHAGPGWPSAPADSTGHFNGQIADVAAFDHIVNGPALFAQTASAAAFDAAVVDAHPSGYWRLNDTAGNQAAELLTSQALAQNQGTYSNVALNAGGLYGSGNTTAATFNGTTSYVQLPTDAAPHIGNTATVEVWFKTASPGVIYGYQSDPIGTTTPATSTPVLYVGTDGKLHGQVWNGDKNNTAVSTGTVNDNTWHMATLLVGYTSGNFFQQLYVDGAPTGSPVTGPTKFTSTQYAYLGAGNVTGWPSQPADTKGHFNGQIADLSYYGYALESSTIARHYVNATAPAGEAGSQSANYRTGVIGSTPEAYWRLNDPAGATIVQDTLGTALPNQEHGTYTATTLGVAGPSGSSDGTAASFDGTTSSLQLPNSAAPVRGANSIELWFKTGTAGVLYGYQSFPLASSPNGTTDRWNPALYVGSDGKLYGTLWTGDPANALVSAKTVNDNAWHHAVIAGDDNGQTLYLDGTKTADSTTKRTVYYNGATYVYVGAGTATGGWPNQPTSPDGRFTGTIAEVAHYPSVLSADTVTAHYKAMGSASAQTKTTVATVTDPLSHTLTWRWDTGTGRLTAATDANAATIRYSYDTHGYLYSVTDADGHSTTTGHDDRGNPVSTTTCTDAAHCHTSYATYSLNQSNPFDPANDRPLTNSDARAKDASDATFATTYAYTKFGDPSTTTTPATPDFPSGRTGTVAYTTSTDPAVGSTGTQPAALVASSTDTAGATTAYAYDKNGNLTRTTTPTGLVTTYTYDNLGRRTTATTTCTDCGPAASSTTTSYTWDGLGHPLTQTDPATTDAVTGTLHTRRTAFTYDNDGNLLTQTVSDTTGGDTPRTTAWSYNNHNLLATTTDPAGRTTTYAYDGYGNTTTKTDPAGTKWTYTYDGQSHLLRTYIGNYTGSPTDPVPSRVQAVEARAYDPAGRLATVTDAMGRTSHAYYNDDNTVAEVDLDGYRNPDGTQRTVVLQQNTYDAARHLTQQTTGGGKTTTVTVYDAASRTASTTLDPGGLNRTTTYTYDAGNNVLSTVLSGGGESRETDATYNKVGQVLTRTVKNTPADSVVKNTYDQRGLPLTTVSPLGNAPGADPAAHTTTFVYDAAGRTVQSIGPAVTTDVYNTTTGQAVHQPTASITTTGYNTFGDHTSTEDPNGNITTLTYNADSQVTAAASNTYTAPGTNTAVTPVTTIDYDTIGRPATITVDPNGLHRTSTLTYDQLGNLVRTTSPPVDGTTPTVTTAYDLAGEPLTRTDPTGAVTQATYDDLGRIATTTDLIRTPTPAAYTTTYGYDDAGNQTSTTDPNQHTTTAAYNAAHEATTTTDALGHTTTYTHNLTGQLLRTTLPDGTATTHTRDRAGQETATAHLASNGTTVLAHTSAAYDTDGNRTSATDENGYTTTYVYDAADRIVQQTQPVTTGSSIMTGFGHDPAGNLTRYTHTRTTGGTPADVYYTYNTLGLAESTVEPATTAYPNPADRTYTRAYDAAFEPVSDIQPGGITTGYAYDADGRLTQQTGSGAEAATATRSFGYDPAGRLTTAATGTNTNTYTYDDRSLITGQAGTAGQASFTYDGAGNLTARTDAAGTAAFGYDANNQLTTQTEPLTGARLTYTYDTVGQLTTTHTGGTGTATRTYAYDDLHRLTADTLTNPAGTTEASITYGYDPKGHLTSKTTTGLAGSSANTYTYDQADRLTSWNNGTATTAYAYDNDGNLTQSGATTSTYDDRDRRLTSGSTTYTYTPRGTLSSDGTTTRTYDAFDQQTTNGTTTYTYDALGRLATTGSYAFTYDRTTDNITSDGGHTYDRTPDGRLTALTSAAGPALALNDRHGDLIATYTPTGTTPTSSTAYDPWGNTLATTGTPTTIGYQGGWTDPATHLVNTATRWYDPTAGAFTSRDTTTLTPTNAATANRYAYATDEPLAFADLSGHQIGAPGGSYYGGGFGSGIEMNAYDMTMGGSHESLGLGGVHEEPIPIDKEGLAWMSGHYEPADEGDILNEDIWKIRDAAHETPESRAEDRIEAMCRGRCFGVKEKLSGSHGSSHAGSPENPHVGGGPSRRGGGHGSAGGSGSGQKPSVPSAIKAAETKSSSIRPTDNGAANPSANNTIVRQVGLQGVEGSTPEVAIETVQSTPVETPAESLPEVAPSESLPFLEGGFDFTVEGGEVAYGETEGNILVRDGGVFLGKAGGTVVMVNGGTVVGAAGNLVQIGSTNVMGAYGGEGANIFIGTIKAGDPQIGGIGEPIPISHVNNVINGGTFNGLVLQVGSIGYLAPGSHVNNVINGGTFNGPVFQVGSIGGSTSGSYIINAINGGIFKSIVVQRGSIG
ncbi:LamG-like jellyroll fold domain-containing protein [Kitasatospora cineracea]|uniref:LamG-like jellyroll fold domain-containing protein n=1 Tax=Kitasatospora cineracea TaxID=88074 RepID=UPI0036D9D597